MTESKAVFLSYATQDTAAARRISDALRLAGIEVWFDQSELRGGDAWDQTIRRQIRECALFVPIISAHSQARAEGYFRLEWHLADMRSHQMGKSRPFLVPVCIDDTSIQEADAPDSFSAVQWTRLRDAESCEPFIQRVAVLLALNTGDSLSTVPLMRSLSRPANLQDPPRPPTASSPVRTGSRWFKALLGVLPLTMAIFAVGYWATQRSIPPVQTTNSTVVPSDVPATPTRRDIPEKSVAVLPFVDMSEKKDQEYFSDGLAEQMIDLLSQLSDLRVPARTSSFYFKHKNEPISGIAQQLKVANIVEGSVRKLGKRLRVTVQLIRAENGYHLWSQSYDRQDSDIFAVQDDIAKAVVAALQGKLAGGISAADAARGTSSTDAYNEYLRGLEFFRRDNVESLRRAVAAFDQAIFIDPRYGAAYAELALSEGRVADYTGETSLIERAKGDIEKAIALAPNDSRILASRAFLRINWFWDWAGAQADIEKALALDPRNNGAQENYARLLGYLGRLPEAIAAEKKAIELDPVSSSSWNLLGFQYLKAEDYPAAESALSRAIDLAPTDTFALFNIGTLRLHQGRYQEAVETYRKNRAPFFRLTGIAMAEHSLGDSAESTKALDELIAQLAQESAYQIAEVFAWRNEQDAAFEWLDRAYRQQDGGLAEVKIDTLLKSIRADRRYTALLVKMNLPP